MLWVQYGQSGPSELDHPSLGLEPDRACNNLNPLGTVISLLLMLTA